MIKRSPSSLGAIKYKINRRSMTKKILKTKTMKAKTRTMPIAMTTILVTILMSLLISNSNSIDLLK